MLQDFKFVVFETVVRTGNFRRAAAELDISQPAVSQAVAELEREAGRKLLERGRSGATLTPAGEAFLAYAVGITDAYEEMAAAMRRLDEVCATERVAVYASAGRLSGVAGLLVPYLRKAFPRLEVAFVADPSKADIVFDETGQPKASESFGTNPLFTLITRITR